MNEEHLQEWIAELRTTTEEQCTGQLHVQDDGYCCLGIGYKLVPGYREDFLLQKRLAPSSFLEWLGLERVTSLDEDVLIDWPDDLETQGAPVPRSEEDAIPSPIENVISGAAELNDQEFTFKQIADILDYFGIKERRTE